MKYCCHYHLVILLVIAMVHYVIFFFDRVIPHAFYVDSQPSYCVKRMYILMPIWLIS